MGNLTTALMFVTILNVLMFLVQGAVMDLNPEANIFYTGNGTMLKDLDAGGNSLVIDTNSINTQLPSGQGSVSPTTGNLFTDTFSSIKSWLGNKTGLTYLFEIVSAPYNLLKSLGLPTAFVFALGSLWYILTLFLVISFIWGRDQ